MKVILAASDLSPRSDRAVVQAAYLAARMEARLVLLNVVDDELPAPIFDEERGLALRALESTAARLDTLPRDRIDMRVSGGLDFREILAAAREEEADLIVLGAHRRAILEDILVGTTVERVVRNASTPILVVKRPGPGDYRCTLAALDLTAEAVSILEQAHGLAGGQTLYALHVADDSVGLRQLGDAAAADRHRAELARTCEGLLRGIARRAGLAPNGFLPVVERGSPAQAILDAAGAFGADLGVVGTRTRTRGPMERLLLGSVAERLLLDMPCDVLTVPLEGPTPLEGAGAVPMPG
ncbi:universal stress protein (plasmid) [Skermanella sp. TT6]|uniref:Universal stress protein n=1 Tax=Skermanella cutis TaxID=2775420 RepID=A0ABX7BG49_9PROT|nr:universal stress protein [Skermanella sp. TT6]QQP93370.1 universal stress protein [Skermanella sp. TT6]